MLNKQGIGRIDWCSFSWNPLSGCKYACPYCYLLDMDNRFKTNNLKPAFHPERLNDIAKSKKLKDGDRIFVGSSGDTFGEWVNADHIQQVIDVCVKFPQYIFMFLTKNPVRYAQFDFSDNCMLGTTIDNHTHQAQRRMYDFWNIKNNNKRFISFEPMLEDLSMVNFKMLKNTIDLDLIIIGGESGGTKKPDAWADKMIEKARKQNIKVFVKDNYKYHTRIKEL